MTHRLRGEVVALCLVLATAAAAEAPHVQSGANPLEAPRTLQLRELWRAGGDESELIFGSVAGALAGPDGQLFVLDSQLSQVIVFSPDGKHLRTIGREGDGPGEVRRPSGLMLLPDGALGLIQTFPGKVVKLRPDGLPAGSFTVGSGDQAQGRFSVLVEGQCRGEAVVMAGMHMTMAPDGTSNQRHFLARVAPDGRQLQTYATSDWTINYADFELSEKGLNFVYGRWALGPDGRVYAPAERNRYCVQVFAPDGDLERTFGRDYTPWRRDAAAAAAARRSLEAVGRNYPAPPRRLASEESEADILGVWVSPAGEVWVTPSRGVYEVPAGTRAVMDVFDAQGRFVRQARLVGPGDPRRDAMYFVGADRVVAVTGALDAYLTQMGVSGEGETPALELICYALEPR